MTAQGTPLTRFRRAIQTESIFLAELAARELDAQPHARLPLEDAAELVGLYARLADGKYDAAAQRWLVRLIEERRITLADVQLAATALAVLRAEAGDLSLRLLRELAISRTPRR